MERQINDIRDLIQEIAWHFGDHEFNGERCGGLTFVEFMALKKIDESEYLSIQEVGRALNFTKSGATRLVNRLQPRSTSSASNPVKMEGFAASLYRVKEEMLSMPLPGNMANILRKC